MSSDLRVAAMNLAKRYVAGGLSQRQFSSLVRLARVLGVTVDDLIEAVGD
jgi:hypothetical protein